MAQSTTGKAIGNILLAIAGLGFAVYGISSARTVFGDYSFNSLDAASLILGLIWVIIGVAGSAKCSRENRKRRLSETREKLFSAEPVPYRNHD